MKAIELQGEIDDQHRLSARVLAGRFGASDRFDLRGRRSWLGLGHGISSEWSAELSDPRQDIYTLNDGQPVDAPR
jgi:hypothetical protein